MLRELIHIRSNIACSTKIFYRTVKVKKAAIKELFIHGSILP